MERKIMKENADKGIDSTNDIANNIANNRDDFSTWREDAKKNMQEAIDNLSDTEIAKIKLEKYRRPIIKIKCRQGNWFYQKLQNKIEVDIEETNDIANELESALGKLGESSKIIKDEIKKSIDSLNKIREQMLMKSYMIG